MNIWDNISLAFGALRSNWLRAILTLLIIAFGIMALVGILTATDAVVYTMGDSFSNLGANSFEIDPAKQEIKTVRRGRQFKRVDEISLDQALDFKERYEFPSVVSVSFFATGSARIVAEGEESDPVFNIRGVDQNYLETSGLDIQEGRNFTALDIRSGSRYAVVGNDIATDYFDSPFNALEKTINVDGRKLMIIGVLASQGSSMNSNADRIIHYPLMSAVPKYASSQENYDIKVSVPDATFMEEAISEATGLMRAVRKLRIDEDNDFEFEKSDAVLEIIKDNTATIRTGTIAIGLITILGAAIGLMNIMLVSVTERTKEIGITKALGATRNSILQQFLIEAVIICQLGGIVGIILGILVGNIVGFFTGGGFLIPWMWIIMAFILCAIVGVLSGLFPAIQASKLDPIEALRYE